MRILSRAVVCFLLGLCFVWTFPAGQAAEFSIRPVSYSADSVLEVGARRIPAKVYHDRGRERREFLLAGLKQILILQPDRRRVIYLLPLTGLGMELRLAPGEQLPSLETFAGFGPSRVGREQVEGTWATKYTAARREGPQPFSASVWLSDDGIPLRAEATDTRGAYTLVQRNIARGPQDPKLFEAPPGVTLTPVDAEQLRALLKL